MTESGYLVRGACEREWFVPLSRIRDDYIDFLVTSDGVTREEAGKQADKEADFLHTWFYEQCYDWQDIEHLGRLVKQSTLFKTKQALDRRRGRDIEVLGFSLTYPAQEPKP